MSHKRSLKREINASDTTSDDHPTSWKSLQPKRSRTEDYSEQTKTQDDSSAVRRSSRAPKPKVFDDDYTDTGVRSPGSEHETLKNKEPRSFSRNQGERKSVDDEEFAKRRSSRIPKPKLFDKEYLETAKSRGIEDKEEKNMAFATEVRVSQDWQKESSFHKGSTKCKKTTSVSKQGKADATASTAGGLQPQPAMKGNEGPRAWETLKVRTSLRTPMPKKTFALIDDSPVSRTGEGGEGLFEGDLYVDIITQESYATKHSKKMIIGQSDLDIVGTSPISSKKNWTSKNAGSHAGKHKKLKKLNTVVDSSTVPKDISEAEAPKKSVTIKKQSEAKEKKKEVSPKATSKTSGKFLRKSTTKNKPTDVSEDVVDVVGIQQMEVKKKSKKKKAEVEQSGFPSVSHEMIKTMSTGSEHGKNGSKHSKLKHKDEPHSEVKDKGHHIILKVHLPHGEPYNHSHHSHSHKKHKHKHSSETKNESGSSESKLKKAKSSHESDASTAPDKQRKKISIKFKGLSSPTPGVEFQGTENTAETEKKNKEMERVPKKKKPTNSSLDKPPTASGSHEKEHVKVVIKKNKKDLKVITNEGQKPSKTLSKSTCKDVKEKTKEDHGKGETPIKTTPKKKMKTSESPKSSEKEKRKIVTGYLLFCKKERSRIHEAHPRLEFAQISQKVGEAWKSLPESVKQEWKAKADHVKKNLTPTTKEDKKTESTKPGPDAVDMAAHLKLLGESLSVIGGSLMAQKETEVHGSLSVLLDSILCAICPLTFLTSHIPGIPGISKETQMEILYDLAYTMPGLG